MVSNVLVVLEKKSQKRDDRKTIDSQAEKNETNIPTTEY